MIYDRNNTFTYKYITFNIDDIMKILISYKNILINFILSYRSGFYENMIKV